MTEKLNVVFDEVADLYDASRPTYPPELFEAVNSVLPEAQKHILEIGCGTGQATLPFARQGCHITALEPGRNLAALAAKNLALYPQVDIQTTTFEEWPNAESRYDLVMSATAFHWVSPEVRYVKSAQALKDKGWLALFWNNEADDGSVLAQQIQVIYDKYMPPVQAHPYTTHHPSNKREKFQYGNRKLISRAYLEVCVLCNSPGHNGTRRRSICSYLKRILTTECCHRRTSASFLAVSQRYLIRTAVGATSTTRQSYT